MRYAFLIIFSACIVSLSAQSFFYNTQQYGLRSTLLGGAVTAGMEDLSMVYYNPAALKYARGKGFDLALFSPSVAQYNFGEFFQEGVNTSNRNISLNPSLITYKTDIKGIDIVFTLLQKDYWDNGLKYSDFEESEPLTLNESFSYKYQGDEKWFGFGFSVNLNENIAVGLSQFWSLLSSRYRHTILSEIKTNEILQTNFFSENLNTNLSSNLSMVTKIGMSMELGKNRLGLVITSPNYNALYQGASFDKSVSSLSGGVTSLKNIVDYNLDPETRNAWQIDLGYNLTLPDSSELWVSGAYHSKVDEYDFFEITSVSTPLRVKAGYKEAVNFSIGYARSLNPKIQLLTSYRTNNLAFQNGVLSEEEQPIYVLEGNKNHITAGVKVDAKNSSFAIGLDWGFSVGNNDNLFQDFSSIDILRTRELQYSYNSITLLVTYDFFLDSMGRNISKMLDGKKSIDHVH